MSYQSFVYQVNDGIATLRLNDPDVLNALTFEVYAELEQLTGELAQDETVKILVRIESWSTTKLRQETYRLARRLKEGPLHALGVGKELLHREANMDLEPSSGQPLSNSTATCAL